DGVLMGVCNTPTLTAGYGVWLALLAALQMPYTTIRPATWKRAPGLGKDKEAYRLHVMQLFPRADFRLKKHHGQAEALLLMLYGQRHLGRRPRAWRIDQEETSHQSREARAGAQSRAPALHAARRLETLPGPGSHRHPRPTAVGRGCHLGRILYYWSKVFCLKFSRSCSLSSRTGSLQGYDHPASSARPTVAGVRVSTKSSLERLA